MAEGEIKWEKSRKRGRENTKVGEECTIRR